MSKRIHTKRVLFKYKIIPPKKWRTAATIVVAICIGIGFYILKISNASSYLSDDPKACINCHIMTPEYITWNHSSHGQVTNCNDCHVPHNNIFNKYYFKAKDGLYHASIFTMHAEPEVIRVRPPSITVIKNNCIRCHKSQVTDAKLTDWIDNHTHNRTDRLCWDCHRDVPHGRVRSLSSVGFQVEPVSGSSSEDLGIVPKWLQEQMKEDKPVDKKHD